jgi:outer membrane protein
MVRTVTIARLPNLNRLAGAFLVIVASAGALTGCAVDQEADTRPYQQALGVDGPAPPPLAEDEPIALVDALRLTNWHNEQLRIEGENYVQALIDKQRAIASFLPTAGVFPSYTRRWGDGVSTAATGRAGRDQLEAPVVGDINLFNGYRDIAALYANAATIQQRRALMLNLQSDLLLQTSLFFYDVLRLEQSVEVLRNTSKVQDERVRDIKARQATGLARPLDVSQAEAQAAGTRVQYIAGQNAVRNARIALKLLTATGMEERPLIDDYNPPAKVDELKSWLNLAAMHRHDILAADKALEAARHDVEIAFGQYYPSVTLNLEYLLSISNASTENQWNAVLRANVPIFTAGRIEADVRSAWSRVRQASLDASLTRRRVMRDVELAHQNFRSAHEQIAELQRRVAAAEQALKQAEASYDAGLATNLERLTAQDELLSARLDLVTQRYVYKVAYLAMLRASGVLQQEMNVGLPTGRKPAE